MNPYSKDLNINPDLKEPRSSDSSIYSSDLPHQTSPGSTTLHTSTTRNFFSAIKQGIRRSRSPSPAARSNTSRATTPTPANPPSPLPSRRPSLGPPAPQSAATTDTSDNMYGKRTVSTDTTWSNSSSITATSSESLPSQGAKRSSTTQSDFSRLSYGRHSGEWLFGNTSISGVIKKAVYKKSGSSNN